MSLADELLADLEDADEDIDSLLMPPPNVIPSIGNGNDQVEPMQIDVQLTSVRNVANLKDSEELKRILREIDNRPELKISSKSQIDGPVESHPEYKLIVDANNIAVEIDNEINVIHKYVRDKYSKRFQELESLVPNPLQYLKIVKELGNDLDINKVINNKQLNESLGSATTLAVSLAAKTPKEQQQLSLKELEFINEACDDAIGLDKARDKIYKFVESRMSFIAPNLSVITGPSTAAKLMGLAGGLTNLSKMPACNIEVLGSQRKNLSGFSSTQMMPHTGYVFYTEIVTNTPPDLKRKAARLMANKCAIAARIDASHASSDGHLGKELMEKIERALDKMQEPPPVKQIKPLPAPIDQPQKKRGGKRVRKLKERLVITDLRKQANRMNFGEIEDDAYQNDLGFTTGTMGRTGTGRIRTPQIDEKTKVRISKTLQKNLQKQQTYGGSTTVKKQIAGTASSVAFTPLQGLEIVNPQAAEAKVNEANAKYFSNTSGFLSIKPKMT